MAMAISRFSHPTFAFFLLITALFQTGISIRQLEETNKTNGGDLISTACRHTEFIDFCKSTLQSHPKSHGADLNGLASISVDLSIAQAKDTISYVKKLKTNDTFASACLDDCLTEYYDALDNLNNAKAAIQARSFDDVNAMVSAAMTDSDTCEDGFKDRAGYRSPLSEWNEYFYKLCSNSLAITSLLVV